MSDPSSPAAVPDVTALAQTNEWLQGVKARAEDRNDGWIRVPASDWYGDGRASGPCRACCCGHTNEGGEMSEEMRELRHLGPAGRGESTADLMEQMGQVKADADNIGNQLLARFKALDALRAKLKTHGLEVDVKFSHTAIESAYLRTQAAPFWDRP